MQAQLSLETSPFDILRRGLQGDISLLAQVVTRRIVGSLKSIDVLPFPTPRKESYNDDYVWSASTRAEEKHAWFPQPPISTNIETSKSEKKLEVPENKKVTPAQEEPPPKQLKEWKKDHFKILLIGEERVGRTMFISYLDNMLQGRNLQDFRNPSVPKTKAVNGEPQDQNSVADLCTLDTISCPTISSIPDSPAKTIQILNIPRLGDVHGFQFDSDCRNSIANIIEKELTTIDAVIVMADNEKGTLNTTTRQALENICSILPKAAFPNVGFLVMNCDWSTINFDSASLPKEYQEAPLWILRDPSTPWNDYVEAKRKKLFEGALEHRKKQLYKEAFSPLNDFFGWLDALPVQPATSLKDLNNQLTIIQESVSTIMSLIDSRGIMRDKVTRLQARIREHENVRNSFPFLDDGY
jgi:hypothetical protein